MYLAVVVFSLCIGYFGGVASSFSFSRSFAAEDHPSDTPIDVKNDDVETGGQLERDLASVDFTDDCLMALVVRNDLGMSSGKIAAQCSHATLACYKALSRTNSSIISQWQRTGQEKIVLRCEGEEDLLLLQAQAQSLDLCAKTIQDAGRTQIAAGSRTVLGIGPGPARLIQQLTVISLGNSEDTIQDIMKSWLRLNGDLSQEYTPLSNCGFRTPSDLQYFW